MREEAALKRSKERELFTAPCEMITLMFIRKGTLVLTNYEIYFFDDLVKNKEDAIRLAGITFMEYEKPKHEMLYKKWPLFYVRDIQRRRFLTRQSGIEIFMINSKSVMFNFQSTDVRNKFGYRLVCNTLAIN